MLQTIRDEGVTKIGCSSGHDGGSLTVAYALNEADERDLGKLSGFFMIIRYPIS